MIEFICTLLIAFPLASIADTLKRIEKILKASEQGDKHDTR
jgi:hypothetical protein